MKRITIIIEDELTHGTSSASGTTTEETYHEVKAVAESLVRAALLAAGYHLDTVSEIERTEQ